MAAPLCLQTSVNPICQGCTCCRPIYGVEDESQREVRISCPDATGLGCDFARLLLDFGLRITDGARPFHRMVRRSRLYAPGLRGKPSFATLCQRTVLHFVQPCQCCMLGYVGDVPYMQCSLHICNTV